MSEFYKRDEATHSDTTLKVEATHLSDFPSTPEERIKAAYASLHATLRRELLERIAATHPPSLKGLSSIFSSA